VIQAFKGLLAIRHLHLEQDELMRRALEWHRQGMDFADALHFARSEGCGALISFDQQLGMVAEQLSLQPTVRRPL
jgi:predicted nucleic acid-binding protein